MRFQANTLSSPSASVVPADSVFEVTVIHGRAGFVTGYEREQEREAMDRRMRVPFLDTERAALVLNGTEAGAPMFAVGLLAVDQGLTYVQTITKLRTVMLAALYHSGASVAELRRLEDPADCEALARPVLARYGVAYLEALDLADREAHFPQTRRDTAASDAAYRWAWGRFPEAK